MKGAFDIAAALDEVVKWLSQSQLETKLNPDEARRLVGLVREAQRGVILNAVQARGWGKVEGAAEVPKESDELSMDDLNKVTALRGAQLMSEYDILTQFMKMTPKRAREVIHRMKLQRLEDIKLQMLAQNPQIMGLTDFKDMKKKLDQEDEHNDAEDN